MNVAVIGGGYAGMAAATVLASLGRRITVFEAAPVLGGRARRVVFNGTALDNGLHILIGAYSETLRLIEIVAPQRADPFLRLPFEWRMHGRFHLRARALPAPLHLLGGLLTARGITLSDKLAVARFMRTVRAQGYRLQRDATVGELLRQHRQGNALIANLWAPLCIAALNTPPDRASSRIFMSVLRDTLGAERAASDLVLARVDLSALFPEPAADYVRARGGTIELNTNVERVTFDGGAFRVRARGTVREFSHVICAAPSHRAAPLLADIPGLRESARRIAAFEYEPIHSIYLQFNDRVRLPAPMIGMAEGPAQWVFDRERICGQRGLVGAVISASGAYAGMPQDELARRLRDHLAASFGPLPLLGWHRVIAEKRATFRAAPGLDRPESRSEACPRFLLAGDYVACDYPATLETAVRSGVAAASAVIARTAEPL